MLSQRLNSIMAKVTVFCVRNHFFTSPEIRFWFSQLCCNEKSVQHPLFSFLLFVCTVTYIRAYSSVFRGEDGGDGSCLYVIRGPRNWA